MTQQTAETKVPSDIEVSKIPDENGIIESPTEPVKNRKLYWLNTTNKKIYILIKNQYIELKKTTDVVYGQEFETGFTKEGRIEYGKIIDVGEIPNATSKLIPHKIQNLYRYTFFDGYTTNSWPVKMVCSKSQYGDIVIKIEGDNIRITTDSSSWAEAWYMGLVELHYLKN